MASKFPEIRRLPFTLPFAPFPPPPLVLLMRPLPHSPPNVDLHPRDPFNFHVFLRIFATFLQPQILPPLPWRVAGKISLVLLLLLGRARAPLFSPGSIFFEKVFPYRFHPLPPPLFSLNKSLSSFPQIFSSESKNFRGRGNGSCVSSFFLRAGGSHLPELSGFGGLVLLSSSLSPHFFSPYR